jgi:hypothetical protein
MAQDALDVEQGERDLAQSNWQAGMTQDADQFSSGQAHDITLENMRNASAVNVANIKEGDGPSGPMPFKGTSEFAQTANAMWPKARAAGMSMEEYRANIGKQLMGAERNVMTAEGPATKPGIDFGFIPPMPPRGGVRNGGSPPPPSTSVGQFNPNQPPALLARNPPQQGGGLPQAVAAQNPGQVPVAPQIRGTGVEDMFVPEATQTPKPKKEFELRADLVTGALDTHNNYQDGLEGDYTPGFWETALSDYTDENFPAASGYIKSNAYKALDTNADEWARMLVFLRSGATARQEEVTAARGNFWPRAGDDKEEKARKRRMREGAMANAAETYQTRASDEGREQGPTPTTLPDNFKFKPAAPPAALKRLKENPYMAEDFKITFGYLPKGFEEENE